MTRETVPDHRSVARALIEVLEEDDMFGLSAPDGADRWSLDAIRDYFQSDGEIMPVPLVGEHAVSNLEKSVACSYSADLSSSIADIIQPEIIKVRSVLVDAEPCVSANHELIRQLGASVKGEWNDNTAAVEEPAAAEVEEPVVAVDEPVVVVDEPVAAAAAEEPIVAVEEPIVAVEEPATAVVEEPAAAMQSEDGSPQPQANRLSEPTHTTPSQHDDAAANRSIQWVECIHCQEMMSVPVSRRESLPARVKCDMGGYCEPSWDETIIPVASPSASPQQQHLETVSTAQTTDSTCSESNAASDQQGEQHRQASSSSRDEQGSNMLANDTSYRESAPSSKEQIDCHTKAPVEAAKEAANEATNEAAKEAANEAAKEAAAIQKAADIEAAKEAAAMRRTDHVEAAEEAAAVQRAVTEAAKELERRERDAIRMETAKYRALEKAERLAEQASRKQAKQQAEIREAEQEVKRKAQYAADAKRKGLTPLQVPLCKARPQNTPF